MEESVMLPQQVPVMPLPGVLLFPHALLPLYIFEPRYQAMLDQALHQNRMFAVPLLKPQRSQWHSPTDFFQIAGVGLIRACVGRGDGSSNLILQGLARVRFTGFDQTTPYPIASIEQLESEYICSVETEALSAKVLELYSKLKGDGRQLPAKIDRYLSDLGDPEMLADLVASTFISDPSRRQHILEELSVNQRLRILIQYLRDESAGTAAA